MLSENIKLKCVYKGSIFFFLMKKATRQCSFDIQENAVNTVEKNKTENNYILYTIAQSTITKHKSNPNYSQTPNIFQSIQ